MYGTLGSRVRRVAAEHLLPQGFMAAAMLVIYYAGCPASADPSADPKVDPP